MKRSRVQVLPSLEANSKKSRHDLEDVEETPTTNIFLVETILRRLFKQIDSVSMLKDLRNVCQLWDRLDTEELEERAFQGRFKPINLTFYDEDSRRFKSINAIRSKMRRFLRDTRENPKLFRSFALNFPGSLSFLHMDEFKHFYTRYSPTFLKLTIPNSFQFNQDKELLLKGLMRWAAPTLRELLIPKNKYLPVHLAHFPDPPKQALRVLKFPHLQKVTTEQLYYSPSYTPVQAFKIIFTKGNPAETPSLTLLKTETFDLVDLLGLNLNPSRWNTLTELKIEASHQDSDDALYKSTCGLLTLAQTGMTLKKLCLGLRFWKFWNEEIQESEVPHFISSCRNLTRFFRSQASSIEALKLHLEFNPIVTVDEEQKEEVKILLPVFERLHTLSLDLEYLVYINNRRTSNFIEYESMTYNFPALEDLTLEKFYQYLKVGPEVPLKPEERPFLKRLKLTQGEIDNWDKCKLWFFDRMDYGVETFACPQDILNDLEEIEHLMDSIRILHIRDITSILDLSKFKSLRRVVIEEDDLHLEYNEDLPRSKQKRRKLIQHKGRYLGYFKGVAKLGLDSIMFRGLEMFGEENKELFVKAFPFRVEFEEKPVKWFNDFMDNYY